MYIVAYERQIQVLLFGTLWSVFFFFFPIFFICSWLNPWTWNPQIQGPTAFLLMLDPSMHIGPIPPSLAKKKNIENLEIWKEGD